MKPDVAADELFLKFLAEALGPASARAEITHPKHPLEAMRPLEAVPEMVVSMPPWINTQAAEIICCSRNPRGKHLQRARLTMIE